MNNIYLNNDYSITYKRHLKKTNHYQFKYSNKVNKYLQLAKKLYYEKNSKKTFIITLIIFINGLIIKYTVKIIIKLEFNIKYPPIIRELFLTKINHIIILSESTN